MKLMSVFNPWMCIMDAQVEDDCPDTFSEFIFLFPPAAALCHDFSLDDSVET